jgi:TRAP-type C4-dicarboxylate transport system substrate-binding protein
VWGISLNIILNVNFKFGLVERPAIGGIHQLNKFTLASAVFTALLATQATAEDIDWRYFGAVPVAHDVGKIVQAGFDRVEERTGGKLSIEYLFYGETPYKTGEGLTLLRDGLVELTEWLPAYNAGSYPLLTGPELPFAASDYVSTKELHEQARIGWENPAIQSYENELLGQHNAVRLTRLFYEPMNLWFKDDLDGYGDIAGRKIRTISPEQAEFVSAMGGTPVAIPGAEVYTSLQRGLVDGTVIGSSAIESFKLLEVINTAYLANVQLLSTGMLASQASMDTLPENIKSILLEEMEAVQSEARAFIADQEGRDLARFEAGGMKIVRPSETDYDFMRQVARESVWPAWAERAGERSEQFLDAVTTGDN